MSIQILIFAPKEQGKNFDRYSLTLIGNITKTPARQYLRGNKAILRMTIASTPRYYSKAEQAYVDGGTTYMPVEMRSTGSEKNNLYIKELTDQFQQGDRVIVVGNLVAGLKKKAMRPAAGMF